jgi:hypothetical protein
MIVELYQKFNVLKKEYIEMQNDILYEKWELNDKKKRTEKLKSIKKAYITFKSMRGKQIAQRIFGYAKENEKGGKKGAPKDSKAFFGRYLTVNNTVAMSSIKW